MSATKNLAWDQATEFLSKIESKLLEGEMTKDVALKKLTTTNYTLQWKELILQMTQKSGLTLLLLKDKTKYKK